MRWPALNVISQHRQVTDRFLGYNHHLRTADGEFYNMGNLTSDQFPLLATRDRRGLVRETEGATAMVAKEELCYVQGSTLVLGEQILDLGLTPGEKQLVSMGAFLVIFPDKVYVNTADLTDFGPLEQHTVTAGEVHLTMTRLEGDPLEITHRGTEAPAEPTSGTLWLDTEEGVLKQWSSSMECWITFAATYVRISAPGIGLGFAPYDGITLEGLPAEAGVETSAVIQAVGEDYITVPGLLPDEMTVTDPITLRRSVPEMDFVIECRNRLWGCRSGPDGLGNTVNMLYASKLGDFRNWNCFQGVSTDSYYVNLGSDGPFTGASGALGVPLFFKENCLHRVYGDIPAEFALQDMPCRGLQAGCHRSLALVNEQLIYKSRHAICAYDGSLPVEISAPLGEERYAAAVAGALGSKYYISMEDSRGENHLFVLDAAWGLWHREDDLRVVDFAALNGELYGLDTQGRILAMGGSGEPAEKAVEWFAETGILATDLPGQKFISRLTVRMSMAAGGRARFFLRYDSLGGWIHAGTVNVTSLRSFSLPIRPRRCDHLQLRIEGIGEARIYSLTKVLEEGGEVL